MRLKNKEERLKKILYAFQRYLSFFLLMAFVITCCMILFMTKMQSDMNIEFTEENIGQAAILTFWNVVLLSLLCTVIDGLRRKIHRVSRKNIPFA